MTTAIIALYVLFALVVANKLGRTSHKYPEISAITDLFIAIFWVPWFIAAAIYFGWKKIRG